jgi:hypothetical protein
MRFLIRRSTILSFLLIIGSSSSCSDSGTGPGGDPTSAMWAVSAGGSGSDFGYSVTSDPMGNVYVSGTFSGEAIFGPDTLRSVGGIDCFMVKYDSDGSQVWSVGFGGPENDFAFGVDVNAAGQIGLVGAYRGNVDFGPVTIGPWGGQDMYFARYSSDGDFQSVWLAGGPQSAREQARAVAVDVQGSMFVAGGFNEATYFTPSNRTIDPVGDIDGFLLKIASGGPNWVRTAGSTGLDEAFAVAVDASGNPIVAGRFDATVTFGGDTTLTSAGNGDIYVAKYNTNGTLLWAWRAGGNGPGSDIPQALAVAGDNIYLSAIFSGTAEFGAETFTENGSGDVALISLDSDGNFNWARSFGSTGIEYAEGLAPAEDGGVYVGGRFGADMSIGGTPLTGGGMQQTFLARFRSDGSLAWAQSGGGPDLDAINGMCATPGDGVAMTGKFRGDVTFGSHTLVNQGIDDVFVIRTGPTGWE